MPLLKSEMQMRDGIIIAVWRAQTDQESIAPAKQSPRL